MEGTGIKMSGGVDLVATEVGTRHRFFAGAARRCPSPRMSGGVLNLVHHRLAPLPRLTAINRC